MARVAAPSPLPVDVRLVMAGANALITVVSLLLLAGAMWWLARLPLFTVRGITLEGELAHHTAGTLRAQVAPKLSGSFFTLDLERARATFEAVPWVRRAVVRRIWPDHLAVQLEEHRAAALWASDDGNDRLVNSYGEVFEANPGDVEDDALPTLQGPDGSSARLLGLLQRLQPALAPLAARIDTLSMSGRGSLHAELDTGAQIELGRGSDDELVERTTRFVATVPQVIAQHQRPLVHADLRHNGGYAVRLKGISTTLVPGDKTGRN